MKKLLICLLFALLILTSCTLHKSPAAVTLPAVDTTAYRVTKFEHYGIYNTLEDYCICTYDSSNKLIRRDYYDGMNNFMVYVTHVYDTAGNNIREDMYNASGAFDAVYVNNEFSGGRISRQTSDYSTLIHEVRYVYGADGITTTNQYDDTGTFSGHAAWTCVNGKAVAFDNYTDTGIMNRQFTIVYDLAAGKMTLNILDGSGNVVQRIVYFLEQAPSNIDQEQFLLMHVYYY